MSKVTFDYDKESDVMYISFSKPQPAVCHEVKEGVLLRKATKTDKWCGLTIINFSKRCDSVESNNNKYDYDEEADVLYITLGSEEPSYCEEVDDKLLIERGFITNNITGFRILDVKGGNYVFN